RHPEDPRDPRARVPVDRAIPPGVVRARAGLDAEREAARDVVLDLQVPGHRRGRAPREARGVEQAGAVAAGGDGGAGDRDPAAGNRKRAGTPARHGHPARRRIRGAAERMILAYLVRRRLYGVLTVLGVLVFLFVLFFM